MIFNVYILIFMENSMEYPYRTICWLSMVDHLAHHAQPFGSQLSANWPTMLDQQTPLLPYLR